MAISDIQNKAETEVKGSSSITSGGSTNILAKGIALIDTISDANAVGSSGGALAISIGYLDSDTKAVVSEGATISSGADLNIYSDTINQAQNGARAGVTQTDTFIKDQLSSALTSIDSLPLPENVINRVVEKVVDKAFEKLAGDDEEGSDASVQVAGAFALNILDNDVEASLTGNANKTITASGNLNVQSRSLTHGITLASGMAEGGAFGGGAAIAIQAAQNKNQAFVQGHNNSNLTVNTAGLSIQALTESSDAGVTEEGNNDFSAFAYSGQGGADIGLAGALGVNVLDENKVEAFLGGGRL